MRSCSEASAHLADIKPLCATGGLSSSFGGPSTSTPALNIAPLALSSTGAGAVARGDASGAASAASSLTGLNAGSFPDDHQPK